MRSDTVSHNRIAVSSHNRLMTTNPLRLSRASCSRTSLSRRAWMLRRASDTTVCARRTVRSLVPEDSATASELRTVEAAPRPHVESNQVSILRDPGPARTPAIASRASATHLPAKRLGAKRAKRRKHAAVRPASICFLAFTLSTRTALFPSPGRSALGCLGMRRPRQHANFNRLSKAENRLRCKAEGFRPCAPARWLAL